MVLILFWKIVGLISLLYGLLHLLMLLLSSIVAILALLFDRDYFAKNKRRIFWYSFHDFFTAYMCLLGGYEFYKDPEKVAQLGWIGIVIMFVFGYLIYKSGFSIIPKDLEKS